MFSRHESSRIKEEFWTAFGRYMNPVPSAEGLKINWVNYHTRIKDVYFRMNAGNKSAMICISIENNDVGLQDLYFEQFEELKQMLHDSVGEEWIWKKHLTTPEGRVVSRIYKEVDGISIFNHEQWPDLISFFKPRIIALDSFWESARWSFEALNT